MPAYGNERITLFNGSSIYPMQWPKTTKIIAIPLAESSHSIRPPRLTTSLT